ncbi:MAG: ribonuclease HII [Desulfohalobiaceae bacterium]|nr:ribonuclease HII [Desulfohalobiaceae bacterium]
MATSSRILSGVDEAGRGCLAGPVVAAAVVLPSENLLSGLTDSKRLTPSQREELEPRIKAGALSWSLGVAWPREIERINILQATLRAMERSVRSLTCSPDLVLVDGIYTIYGSVPSKCVKQGDRTVPAISAASILAKTFRDRLMVKLDKKYSGYGFHRHKGYATAEHLDSLRRLGPCSMHRRSFRPVRQACSQETRQCLPGIYGVDEPGR